MRVIVKARHMNLTRSLKNHAEDKIGNSLMRIFDRPAAKIEIELSALGEITGTRNNECRVAVFMPQSRPINITEVDDDMYKAIDLARDRLVEQVKRERGRKRNTSRTRKAAARRRHVQAKENLSSTPEEWEKELLEYENSSPSLVPIE